jgi:hypothetical protein
MRERLDARDTTEARNRLSVLAMCLLAELRLDASVTKSLIGLVEPGGIEPPTS